MKETLKAMEMDSQRLSGARNGGQPAVGIDDPTWRAFPRRDPWPYMPIKMGWCQGGQWGGIYGSPMECMGVLNQEICEHPQKQTLSQLVNLGISTTTEWSVWTL